MISGRGNIVSLFKSVSLRLKAELFRKLLLAAGCWVLAISSYSQSNGDYRTIGNVNFSLATNWQKYNGGWSAAVSAPSSVDGVITIQNGHTATVSADVNLDQVVVNLGGILTINGGRTLTLNNGSGTDLDVSGTINNSGTITSAGVSIIFESSAVYNHTRNGGAIPIATWDPASNCNITGITTSAGFTGGLEAQTFGNFTWNCASQNTDPGFMLAANFRVKGDFTVNSTGGGDPSFNALRMSNSGGSYTIIVDGNFVVQNSSSFKMNNSTGSCLITVGKNFTLSSGYFTVMTGPATSTLTVAGDVNISGGTLSMNEDDATYFGILNVAGDFNFSNGAINTSNSGWPGNINFNGSSTQTYTKTGGAAFSNTINFVVLNGSILNVGTSIMDGSDGAFTLNSGGGIITANVQGLTNSGGTGSIRVGGTRTYSPGANYTYDGTSAQTTGNGLTGANNLTINNNAGVTLSNPVSVSGIIALTNGILTTTGANLLSITNTSISAISGGSATSFINGPVKWTLPSNLVGASTYIFPLGKGATFLPFSLVNPTTGAGAVTAQSEAFTGNPGGSLDATTLASKSSTEYWSLVTTANFTNSSVSLARQTAIAPLDAVGGSTTVAGIYTSLEGTSGTFGVTNSNSIGANRFFVLAEKIQTITTGVIAGSPFCAGASVSVPFTITGTFNAGNIFTTQLSDASGSFATPLAIGTLTSTTAGTIPGTIPPATLTGSLYRIRVVSSSPARTGAPNGSDLTVNPQPVGPTLNTKTPNLATACSGTMVSATFNAGTGGVGCTDSYQYQFDGAGGWSVYIPGNTLNTAGHTSVDIQGQRAGCTAGAGCSGTAWVTLASWTVSSIPTPPTVTDGSLCGAGSVTLQAGGAAAGEDYKWYDALTGGNLLHTGGNTFSTPIISSTTNFYVAKYNTSTLCESSRTLVVATIMDEPLVTLGYAYQKTLTIDGSKVVGTNNNFPVLIHLTNNDLRDNVKSPSGFDIIFSDINYNKLDFNLESYNSATGDLLAWVRIPTISAGTNTPIRMFYGNPQITTDQSSPTATWEHGYSGIWHLGTNLFDATTNGNNGTDNNTTDIAGKFARARSFDALTDYISVGTTSMSAASGSVEAWANTNSAAGPTGESYIFGHTTPPYSGPDYHDRIQLYLKSSSNQLALGLGEGGAGHDIKTNIATLANGTWNHIVLNWDGINYEVFVNGVSKAAGTFTGLSSLNTFADIGNDGNPLERNEGWNGIIDEVRISRVVRTAGWIQTEYNNQSNPDGFLSGISGQSINSVYDFKVCENSTGVVYSVPPQANHSYSWTITGGTKVGSGNSITVNWGAAGAGSITLTTTNTTTGCSASSPVYSVVIDPNPVPAISGNLTVCPDKINEVYSTPDISGHSYSWTVTGGTFTGVGTHQISVSWGAGPLGTVSVTETIDATGCSTLTNINVDIEDVTPPTITCPSNVVTTTSSDGLGNCTTTAVLGVPVTSDNCSVAGVIAQVGGVTINPLTYAFPIGITTVTWIVTDGSGLTASCPQTVTVTDNEAPTVSAASDVVTTTSADGTGNCTVAVAITNAVFTDNCSSNLTWVMTGATTGSGSGQIGTYTFPIGVTTITYTNTDGAGLTASDAMTVTVTDNEAPTVSAASDVVTTTSADGTGNCTVAVAITNAVFTDNCSSNLTWVMTGATTGSGSGQIGTYTFPIGVTTITYTNTDGAGLTASDAMTVTVTDNEAPTVSAASDVVTTTSADGTGNCTVAVAITNAVFTDNCSSNLTWAMTGATTASGSGQIGTYTFPIGVTTITYTNTDGAGLTASDAMTVTVTDNEAPTVSAASDVVTTTSADGTGNCTVAVAITNAVFTDNCSSNITWVMTGATTGSGSGQIGTYTFPIGVTTITYTNTDGAGLTASDAMTVTVTDNEAPTVSAASDVVTTTSADGTGNCTVAVAITNAVFTDNCSSNLTWAMTGATTASGSGQIGTYTFPIGVTTITYTNTDGAGLTATDAMTVTVTDNEAPTVSAASDVVTTTSADGTGNCTVAVAITNAVFNDNCSSNLTWAMTGATTGSGSGQIGTYTFPIGVTTITYTNTDGAGLTATDAMTVTVTDNEAPTVSAASDVVTTTSADGTGNCTVAVAITNAVFNDNCSSNLTWAMTGATTGSGSGQIGTYTFPIGVTTITYTNTDGAGLTANDAMTVTVTDNEAPTVSAASDVITTTSADGTGNCTVAVAITNAVFTDNCSSNLTWAMTGATTGSGSGQIGTYTFPIGVTTITYTNTDGAGLTASDVMTVTVTDNEAPTVSAASDVITTTSADGTGNCTVAVAITNAVFTDNCSSNLTWAMTGATTASGSGQIGTYTFPIGVTTITYTNTDGAGLTASDAMTVTVTDNEAPTVSAASDVVTTTSADGTGNCTVAVAITNAVFTDNCSSNITWVMTGATTGSGSGQIGTYTFPIGVTTITYTNTDGAGLTATDAMTVTVTDNEPPTITCPSNVVTTTSSDGLGNCTTTASLGVPVTSDNCSVAGFIAQVGGVTINPLTYAFPIGITTVTWIVTDGSGLTASCPQTVTVTDNEAPTVSAASDVITTTSADGTGNCTVAVAITNAVFTDNCSSNLTWAMTGATTGSGSGQIGTYTFPIGVTTITYTNTDGAGLTATDAMTVTVTDNEAPTVSAASDVVTTTSADGTGNCTVAVAITNAVFNDNCSSNLTWAMTGATTGSGSGQIGTYTFPIGVTTITYTNTDGAGLTASNAMTVTVTDNEPPTITCPSNVVTTTSSDGLGNCTTTAVLGVPVTSDNCSVAGFIAQVGGVTINPLTYDFPIGITTVTWIVTDGSGLTASCPQTVTVTDNEAPTVSAASDVITTTSADGTGNCTVAVAITNAVFTDNCSSNLTWAMTGATTGSGSGQIGTYTFPIGVTTITYTNTDGAGLTASDAMTVTVTDNEAPTVSAASDVVTTTSADGTGNCTVAVAITNAVFTDNCSSNLTWAMTGATTGSGSGQIGTYTFPIGVTTITYTNTDGAGLTASDAMTVTVTDNEAPTVSAASDVVTTTSADGTGNCTVAVAITNAVFTDNCSSNLTWAMTGATTGSGSGQIGTYTFPIGVTTITYTNTDGAGLTATDAMTVTVTDNEPPTITCPSNVVTTTSSDGLGNCTTTASLGVPVTSDNCSVAGFIAQVGGVTINPLTYAFPIGITTVTWIVTDGSGLTASCPQTVTVTDNEAPTVSAASDVITTTSADGTGNCTVAVAITNAVFTDNCSSNLTWAMTGATTGSGSGQIGTYTFPIGVTTITYTNTDGAGLTAIDALTVSVTDNELPTIICPDDISQNDDPESDDAQVTVPDAVIADNCSVTLLTWTMMGATVATSPAVGINQVGTYTFNTGVTTVTYIVKDAAGNQATCFFTVTITDNINPTITCPSNISQNDDAGVCTALVAVPNVTIADNFSLASLTWTMTGATVAASPAAGINQVGTYTFNTGVTIVTYIVKDPANNEATCNFTVTIIDNILPTISCPPNILHTADASLCNYSVAVGLPVTNDNCGVLSVVGTRSDALLLTDPYPVGLTTIHWVVTDVHSNSSSCDQTITVTDDELPVAICKNINVDLDLLTGLKTITAADINNGSFDNCGIASISASKTNFDCTNVGTNNVILTVTDVHGNVSTCNAIVTVDYAIVPDPIATPASAVICNGGSTNIVLTNNLPVTSWTWTISSPPQISGGSDDLSGTKTSILQVLTNSDDIAHKVVYTIVPKVYNSCNLVPITAEVWVEPTPQVTISTTTPVICDGSNVDVTITSPTITTAPGNLSYVVGVTSTDGAHLGGTASTGFTLVKTDLPFTIDGTLTNSSDAPIIVTYTVTPELVGCSDGPSQVVTVTVNPTPQVVPSTLAQTICNDGTTSVTLASPSTFTSGVITFNYTVVATGGVTGFTTPQNGLSKDHVIADVLHNPTDDPQTVTYTIVPISPTGCAAGPSKVVVITVEPTPQVTISTTTPVICDGSNVDVTITSPTITTAPGNLSYVVGVTSTDGAHLGGTASTGFTLVKTDLPFTIDGTLTNSSDAPIIVTYTVTPELVGCSDGPSQVVTVTVNPTPQVVPSTLAQTICNDGTTSVTLASPSTFTSGVITFNYTVVATGGVTGFTTPQNGLSKDHVIADVLHNPTDDPQTVTYTIVPISPTGCAAGPSKVVVITVEPTPQVTISTTTPVICDGSNVDVTITSPTITTAPGNLSYVVGVTSTDGAHLGGTASTGFTLVKTDLPFTINGTLTNSSDAPIIVTFRVTPELVGCSDGPSQVVTVTVNPTPQVVPSTLAQTICNDGTTSVTLASPSTFTSGVITFNYTVVATGGVTGFTTPQNGLSKDHVIADVLHNPTDDPQTVTYTIVPISPTGCAAGPSKVVVITVDPTPQVVPSTLAQTICNDGTTSVTLASPSTFTSGVITFNYTVVATGGVTGFTTPQNGLPKDHVIADVLHNPTDDPQTVTYTIVPISPTGCAAGPSKVVVITVEPTPQVTISTTTPVICDGSNVDVTITSPTITTAPGNLSYVVGVTSTDGAHLGGTASTGFTLVKTDLPFTINGTLTNSSDAPIIVTFRVTPELVGCSDGPSQVVTVTVNPTPQVVPSTLAQTICNDGTTSVTLASPSTFTSGVITFNYTVVATGGVTGFTTPQNGLPKDHVIADVLHNPTDDPQTVTYTIVPISPTGCAAGPSKVVVITVDPTPQVVPSTLAQTICNDGTTSVTLASPSTFTSGVITFNYTVVATGGVTGFTTPQNGLPKDHVIADVLHNPTDDPQTVTYTIVPISPTGCAAGPSKVVVITVNPTPQVVPGTLAQTICNDGTTSVTLASPSTFTSGVITFNYTVVATGGVTGFTTPQNGLPKDHVIADVLNNPTDAPQTVTYTIIPISPTGCAAGPSKVVVITVNPTPQVVPSTLAQTICNDGTTSVTLASPSTFTSGAITFNYTVVATGGVTGFTTPQNGLPKDHVIADVLHNPTDDPQTVTYTIVPISPTGCAAGPTKIVIITIEPTPHASISTTTPTICDGSNINVTINSPTITTAPGNLTYVVGVTSTDGAHLGGTASTGFTLVKTDLPFTINGTLTNSSDAPIIVTFRVTPELVGCSDGPSQTVTVTVNPTPQVVPSTLAQTICNDGTTSVTLASPSTFTSGVITFNYTVVVTGGVTGFTTPQNGLPKDHVIADVLHNPTDDPQTVTYTIVPISPTGCAAGPTKVVIITINPTPQVVPSTLAQTICNDGTTNVTLGSPSTFSNGLITFNYTVIATGGVTGFSTPVTGLPKDYVIADVLHNPTDAWQTITYTIIPRSPAGCTQGPAKIVVITINPTPRIFPTPSNTIQCDKTTTSIQLQSPSTFTGGFITFDYSVTSTGGVTGFSTPVAGRPNNDIIADNLVNSTDHFQNVYYNVVPVNPTGCNDGIPQTITVTVNPTPRVIPDNLVPAICYVGTKLAPVNTQIVLNSLTVMAPGWGNVRFDYTVSVTGGAGEVVGNTTPVSNLIPGSIINFSYQNNSASLQYVKYFITPKVDNAVCVPGLTVESDVAIHAQPSQGILVTKPLTCDGGSDASLRVEISSGADPYHNTWDGPSNYHKVDLLDVDNLSYGKYVVNVTDNLGCHKKDSIIVSPSPARPLMMVDVKNPSPPNYNLKCIGDMDGGVTVMVTAGITPPYDYWLVKNETETLYSGQFSNTYEASDPTTFTHYSGLGAGNYTLIIHDVNGCENRYSAAIKAPPPIAATFNKSQYDGGYNVSCKGYNNGSISIQSITGGRPGSHLYNWSTTDGLIPGPTNLNHIDNLIAGTYYVEITDVTPCTQLLSTVITEPGGMQLTGYQLSKSPDGNFNVSCNGGNDGTISMTITGGSGNYVYSWTGPGGFTSATKDLTGLKAGLYTCTVTDLNGCLLTPSPSFTLTEPAPLTFSSFTTSLSTDGTHNLNCYGNSNGWINLSVIGGSVGSYTYNWSTTDGKGIVNGNKDQTSLTAGTYHLIVTDANNCVLTKDITLTQPLEFTSQLTTTDITCKSPGFNNGSIDLTATGGTAPYSYLWSNGSATKDITGLTAGNYEVIITDINGCIKTDSANIELPPDLSYVKDIPEFNGYNISCNGLADGSINIDLTSGAPPYSYTWTGPNGFAATTKKITGLRAGQYHMLITDINECKASEVFNLTEPGRLDMNFILSASKAGGYNINCAGDVTGSIDVLPVNQVKTVEYLWADGIFGKTRSDLAAGNYNLIITDANNCHASATITLTQPDPLKNALSVIPPFCPDKPDGRIDANTSGGVAGTDYSYRWSDNSANKSLLNIPEGFYKVTISDLNGCSIRDSVIVYAENETCLVIPNAISPNGDLINDVWNIGLKELYPGMEVKIFNRWGESIWKSAKGYPEPWDGTSNGRSLPIDSYHYIIDLHDGSKPIVGNVTIVK